MVNYDERLTALEAAVEALPMDEAGPIQVLCTDFYGNQPDLPSHPCPFLNEWGRCAVCDEYARTHPDPAPAAVDPPG